MRPRARSCLMAWLKVFHLFGVIAWFAGLFYLPRLFVYHRNASDETSRTRFVTMEQRLLRIIMLPAALTAIVFGGWIMLLNPEAYLSASWFLAKLGLVIALIAFHVWCSNVAQQFARGGNPHSVKLFRTTNEVPTVILLLLLICAIVRPF